MFSTTKTKPRLTAAEVRTFLAENTLMSLSTSGDHPWSATVYYAFDADLALYFLSDPRTLHCRQIAQNPQVAVAIANSHQAVVDSKRGLQLWGEAEQISSAAKLRFALDLWKRSHSVVDPQLDYKRMLTNVISGRMYKITPKKIKLFDQSLFPDVEEGDEPVLVMD